MNGLGLMIRLSRALTLDILAFAGEVDLSPGFKRHMKDCVRIRMKVLVT